MRIEINKYIVADSEICHGKPTFKGTRVMVHTIFEMLEAGASIKEIMRAYPALTRNHIKASMDLAVSLTNKRFRKVPA